MELTDNSLENLEVRSFGELQLSKLQAQTRSQLLINITTPSYPDGHCSYADFYRVDVVPGNATELIVRKEELCSAALAPKIKGGNKVIVHGNSYSVAKLKKEDKTRDSLESRGKELAQTLARAKSPVLQGAT